MPVVNPDVTVAQAAKEAGVEITGYARVAVGEGIEKKEEDFAAEVAKAPARSARRGGSKRRVWRRYALSAWLRQKRIM